MNAAVHPIVPIMDRCFSRYLPASRFDSRDARILLVAISGQEADLRHRWQVVDLNKPEAMGPARGLWQFERGTRASRGGVWGVVLHPASAPWLRGACKAAGVEFEASAIYDRLHADDALACAVARLLLWTDPHPLPRLGEVDDAWEYYDRNWQPGKPHPDRWPANYSRALRIVQGAG